MEKLTLVVMKLFGMMTVELVQEFDNISIGIRSAESVSSAVEAENQFVWLFGLSFHSGRHLHKFDNQERQIRP